jgi:hypothetical protein
MGTGFRTQPTSPSRERRDCVVAKVPRNDGKNSAPHRKALTITIYCAIITGTPYIVCFMGLTCCVIYVINVQCL